MRAAQELAAQLGTTSNDAIVRLAEDGAVAAERRKRVERLARERREAVRRPTVFAQAVSLPPADEMRKAMLSGREDDDES